MKYLKVEKIYSVAVIVGLVVLGNGCGSPPPVAHVPAPAPVAAAPVGVAPGAPGTPGCVVLNQPYQPLYFSAVGMAGMAINPTSVSSTGTPATGNLFNYTASFDGSNVKVDNTNSAIFVGSTKLQQFIVRNYGVDACVNQISFNFRGGQGNSEVYLYLSTMTQKGLSVRVDF